MDAEFGLDYQRPNKVVYFLVFLVKLKHKYSACILFVCRI